MPQADRTRVLAERIAVAAAAVAQAPTISEAQALAEISETLRSAKIGPASADAIEALTLAAVMYAVDEPARDQWWFPAAFDFLVGLGANADVARAVRAAVKG
jgi:hypothetical protein